MLRAYEHTKAIGIFAPGLLLSKSPTTYSQIDTARFVDGIYSHKPPMKLFRDIFKMMFRSRVPRDLIRRLIVSVMFDSFVIDYGNGTIQVI
jgi:hypothetical protein